MGKEAPRPRDRPPDLADTIHHAEPIAPIYLGSCTYTTPHLKIHDRDSQTVLVHLDFCYSDVNHGPSTSDTLNAARYSPAEHDPGPAILVNSVKIELGGGEYDQIMSKRELEQYVANVRTRYKRKDKKIHPANVPLPTGVSPGVNSELLRGHTILYGSRLTSERLASMSIDVDFLSDAEKQLFIDIPLLCLFCFSVMLRVSGLVSRLGMEMLCREGTPLVSISVLLFLAFVHLFFLCFESTIIAQSCWVGRDVVKFDASV